MIDVLDIGSDSLQALAYLTAIVTVFFAALKLLSLSSSIFSAAASGIGTIIFGIQSIDAAYKLMNKKHDSKKEKASLIVQLVSSSVNTLLCGIAFAAAIASIACVLVASLHPVTWTVLAVSITASVLMAATLIGTNLISRALKHSGVTAKEAFSESLNEKKSSALNTLTHALIFPITSAMNRLLNSFKLKRKSKQPAVELREMRTNATHELKGSSSAQISSTLDVTVPALKIHKNPAEISPAIAKSLPVTVIASNRSFAGLEDHLGQKCPACA